MIFEKLKELISEQFSVDEDSVTMDTSFEEDLGADSLDVVELTMAIEEEFDLEDLAESDAAASLATVGDLVRWLQARLDA